MTTCRSVIIRSLILFLTAFAHLAATAVALAEFEARIWTDKSGKHQIKATLIDFKDGTVRLERPNGNISKIPLAKLSQEDQAYVRTATEPARIEKKQAAGLQVGDRVEAKPLREWEKGVVTSIDYDWDRVQVRLDSKPNTDWPVDLNKVRYPGTNQVPKLVRPEDPDFPKLAKNKIELTKPDESDMLLLVGDGADGSAYSPDPATEFPNDEAIRAIRLSRSNEVHDRVADFSMSERNDLVAAVLYSGPMQGRSMEELSRIQLLDLQTRKTILAGTIPPDTKEIYLSPSGNRIATIPEKIGDEATGQIDFWKIEDKQASHLISFAPNGDQSWSEREVKWFSWLDDDHVLTCSGKGRLVFWKVEGAKAIYELVIGFGYTPLLSHGRKQLLVPTNEGIQVFDARSGDQIAQIGSGNFRGSALALSPSGKQLAYGSAGYIEVLDMTTGEKTRSFPCRGYGVLGKFWWIDEERLFVDERYIVDVARRIISWDFQISSQLVKRAASTQWAYLEDYSSGLRLLQPFPLPPPEAVEAASHLGEDELLAVKPGMSVSIDVQIEDNIFKQDVQEILQKNLARAGLQVAEDQPLQLVARMMKGKDVQMRYQTYGIGSNRIKTLSVTPHIFELELLDHGVSLWKRSSTQHTPGLIRLKLGETVETAIERLMKPSAGNFARRLPGYVVKPEYSEPLGTSKLSVGR